MSFNHPENRASMNPAAATYRWSGGEKEIELPDGTTAKQAKSVLRMWDGEKTVDAEMPFEFCVLAVTNCLKGYVPSNQGAINYYSTEFTNFQHKIKLMRRDQNGTTQLFSKEAPDGLTYSELKAKGIPAGCKYTQYVYFYNPKAKRIERFEFSGSSVSAFIEFSTKNKLYSTPITIEPGELKKTPVANFIVPKFTAGEAYSEEQVSFLGDKCKEIDQYLARLNSKDTPTQEETVVSDEDEPIDLSDIPF